MSHGDNCMKCGVGIGKGSRCWNFGCGVGRDNIEMAQHNDRIKRGIDHPCDHPEGCHADDCEFIDGAGVIECSPACLIGIAERRLSLARRALEESGKWFKVLVPVGKLPHPMCEAGYMYAEFLDLVERAMEADDA